MKVIIVFGSFVGNTETLAGYVRRGLELAGHAVACKDVVYADLDELAAYDAILLASPTYEPKMVQDDMLPFYDRLAALSLAGKTAAAFGPGDTAWPDFCEAVHYLEQRLRDCGATIAGASLLVDGVVEDHEAAAVEWGKAILGPG